MISNTVDRAIKEVWMQNVQIDYANHYLLLEDSLKNAFYYHLRTKLTDRFLISNHLRIFTELNTGFNERIDIAVVRIDDNEEEDLINRIAEYVAVIELKYKGGQVSINPFVSDIQKIRKYLKRNSYSSCQYYLGFIHEANYDLEETSWLSMKEQQTWAVGSLTELSGHYTDDKKVFTILSYNGMNEDLNDK